MQVTMVKKRLASGEPCNKCDEAEQLLRRRGAWERVDRVIWAIENDPDSEGMALARRFGVENAPFFIVDDGARERPYESVLGLMRELVEAPAPAPARRGQPLSLDDIARLEEELSRQSPQEILRFALTQFGSECGIAFSGAEDVALIDMAVRLGLPFHVFCLDTGRLHPETYRFIDQVRLHYAIEIDLLAPATEPLQAFVRKKGLFSFYEDGHKECCSIRKVEPLRRALSSLRGWVTGQRKDQSPATRSDVPVIQLDTAFRGREDGDLVKCNPLSNWTSRQTWDYLRANAVPFNALHERGFASIGCEPCTRPTLPGQHEREGRWWWEDSTRKECGLHSVPPPPPR